MLIHTVFDALALLAAIAAYRYVPVGGAGLPGDPWQTHPLYIAAGSFGATLGAYLAGSGNLWLTGIPSVARSIEGAVAGGIVGIIPGTR